MVQVIIKNCKTILQIIIIKVMIMVEPDSSVCSAPWLHAAAPLFGPRSGCLVVRLDIIYLALSQTMLNLGLIVSTGICSFLLYSHGH